MESENRDWGREHATERSTRIKQLIERYDMCFSQGEGDVGRTGMIQHKIEIVGERPRRHAVRPLNPHMRSVLENEVKDLLQKGFIQPSKSEYASPVVLVKKKDGSVRFCCDFRRLNEATRKDCYPLPRIAEVLDTLSGAKVFSTLDLKSGYHQIEMFPADIPKTAFITQFGLFEWKVMPMGLCSAPGTFQRLMDTLMTGLTWKSVLVYLDDLIIFGRDYEEHYARLEEVLQRIRQANLKLSPKKCHLLKHRILYLGHSIENGKISPDPEKTRLVDTYPVPRNVKDIRSFVSLASYYRRFVKNFAQIAKPLTAMLEKTSKFDWNANCQQAFDVLKNALSRQTNLMLPDFSKPFQLACDASNVALGAVLSQVDEDNREHPVAFASKVLSKQERNWTVTEREAFAIVWAVNHFRSFLMGQPFKLISDHKPLLWLRQMKNPCPKLARWILQLEEYNFDIEYKEGPRNANADAMSRLSIETSVIEVRLESELALSDLKEAQQGMIETQQVGAAIRAGNWDNINSTSPIMKAFMDIRHELFIDDDVIFRQINDRHCQAILPPSLHEKVLQIFHTSETGGHLGVHRTVAAISELFYWPCWRKIVSNFISQCITCEKFKPSKVDTRAYLQPIVTQRPWELIEIDFVGPMPETVQGNKYILSVVDHFSKYAVAYATPRQDSKTVVDCLTKLFAEFGIPTRILSDQGRSFISQEFLHFCTLWGVKKATSTSYHPQTQGLVERFNGTVIQILKKYVYMTQDMWDERLPFATYAYNTTVQRTNEVTPFEVIFGRKPAVPLSQLIEQQPDVLTTHERIVKMKKEMDKIYRFVQDKQDGARNREKQTYDSDAGGSCFSVGDQVWLFNPAVKLGQNRKLSPIYVGPFVIIEQTGVTNFKIKPVNGDGREQIVHQNRLKKVKINQLNNETVSKDNEEPDIPEEEAGISDDDSDFENIVWSEIKEGSQTLTEADDEVDKKVEQMEHNEPAQLDNNLRDAEENRTERQDQIIEQQLAEENDEDDEDPTYVPGKEDKLPGRRNPERVRRRPARVNTDEYEVNVIEVDKKHTENRDYNKSRGGINVHWWLWAAICFMILEASSGKPISLVRDSIGEGHPELAE